MHPDRHFEVGDHVVIRDWEDMAEEFNAEDDASRIRVGDGCVFVSPMRRLCGSEGTIVRIYKNEYRNTRIELSFGVGSWKISPGMLRHADDCNRSADVDRDRFIEFLSEA